MMGTRVVRSVLDRPRSRRGSLKAYCNHRHQLLTGHGELMLAEFKYGLEPKETFAKYLGDQAKPRRCVPLEILLHVPLTVMPGRTTTSRRTSFRSFTGITCYRGDGSGPRA